MPTQKNRGVEKILKRFLQRLDESERHHNELMVVVGLHRHRASLESLLATQFVLSLAVMWEAFVSDLILTYVTVSPETYLQNLKKRIDQSLNDKFGPGVAKRIRFTCPQNFNRAVAHSFLDHKGRNVTANSAQDLADRANEFLTGSLARKFSLDSDDRMFVDVLLGVRNFLSHRSKQSLAVLKKSVSNLTPTGNNGPLCGQLTTVESFLKKNTFISKTRATFISARIREVASKLAS
jgi:hypothetical protein